MDGVYVFLEFHWRRNPYEEEMVGGYSYASLILFLCLLARIFDGLFGFHKSVLFFFSHLKEILHYSILFRRRTSFEVGEAFLWLGRISVVGICMCGVKQVHKAFSPLVASHGAFCRLFSSNFACYWSSIFLFVQVGVSPHLAMFLSLRVSLMSFLFLMF